MIVPTITVSSIAVHDTRFPIHHPPKMFWKKATPGLPPEWMIVGLGNPGGEYKGTRHNVGFDVIDRLADNHRIKVGKAKHRAITGVGKVGDTQVLLVKPLTYMNLSGDAVAALVRYFDIDVADLLVIVDEAALPFGKLRARARGSAGRRKRPPSTYV